jgi:hypothetical protein
MDDPTPDEVLMICRQDRRERPELVLRPTRSWPNSNASLYHLFEPVH